LRTGLDGVSLIQPSGAVNASFPLVPIGGCEGGKVGAVPIEEAGAGDVAGITGSGGREVLGASEQALKSSVAATNGRKDRRAFMAPL
jgi:hypothetical protein